MSGVPIWEKQNLTIEEAAEYSNIGEKKLSELANNPMNDFILHIGKKRLFKRRMFDDYIESQIEL